MKPNTYLLTIYSPSSKDFILQYRHVKAISHTGDWISFIDDRELFVEIKVASTNTITIEQES